MTGDLLLEQLAGELMTVFLGIKELQRRRAFIYHNLDHPRIKEDEYLVVSVEIKKMLGKLMTKEEVEDFNPT